MRLDDELAADLEQLHRRGRYRTPRRLGGVPGPIMELDGEEVLVCCANNYLDLAGDERVREAAQRATREHGVGATGAPLVSGHSVEHELLAQTIAEFRGAAAAILFPSGFQANVGVITALLGRRDRVVADRLAHASILDGCRLSGAALQRFNHNDPDHLEYQLRSERPRRTLIVVEGLYSMEGDLCPLPSILEVAKRHDALLMLDDAHACGVLGDGGRGTDEHFGVIGQVDVYLGTFGKAFGAAGAFVTGSSTLVQALQNRCRSYIYSTASPPAVAAAARRAVEIAASEPERRQSLLRLCDQARQGLRAFGFAPGNAAHQILPVPLGSDERTVNAAQMLLGQGIFLQAIRPPTVPEGTARLRMTLSAGHSQEQVHRIVSAIAAAAATR